MFEYVNRNKVDLGSFLCYNINMRIINAKFIKSASKKDEFIVDELPQIAIVGRSNVGKSSLINLLTNNSKMAKTSSTPGRTRLVNYFNINNQFYLVDLPGYGYHKASKSIANAWDAVMNDYFVENAKLKLVFVLLDSRIEPTELDKQMLDYLATHEIPAIIIMTKTDKISRSEVFQNMSKISKEIRFNKDLIIATSALKKQGVERIETLLDDYIN